MVVASKPVNDESEQQEVGIGIVPTLARFEASWFVIGVFEVAQCGPSAAATEDTAAQLVSDTVIEISDAASVPRHLPQCNAIAVREMAGDGSRQIVGHCRIGVELAFGMQLGNHHAGESLRNAPDSEAVIWAHRYSAFPVGPTNAGQEVRGRGSHQ